MTELGIMTLESRYRRILIIATRQIGDVLCTTPLMRVSRELWPDAIIDVLGYDKTMGMLAGNSDINEVIESPEHPKWFEYKKLIIRIFRKYDLAIVTQPSDRAHIYGMLAAPHRVGIVPTSQLHNWWKKLFSLHTVELDYWSQHVVIERLKLLDVFPRVQSSTTRSNGHPFVSLTPPEAEPLPEDLLSFVSSGSTAVIHATPMWLFKRWPAENWCELISVLVKSGKRVVLTGSSSQQDRELNVAILTGLIQDGSNLFSTAVKDYSGRLSLGQITSLFKAAQLYVGVDTSITHLAASCGIKTIALLGPTAPTNFGPWPERCQVPSFARSVWDLRGERVEDGIRIQTKENVTIVQGPGGCVPCRKAGCLDTFESHSDCLKQLTARSVVRLL